LASVIGHADRVGPLQAYCMGLLLPRERKSVELMAAMAAPARVLGKVRELVMPEMQRHGPSKHGLLMIPASPNTHSVGVARQYCGQLGKQDNCQIAVSLLLANHHASLPVAYRLYLPKEWVDDGERRRKVGAPGDLVFKARLEIALE
jgi:SRSO17 transposase